ncbi:unnamed protein product [Arabidopsis thaliana]|uniref:C2H2-type domain-containing protein n=1 Tax=Arabidopsis thaliana TaxID=3702 RepID=A0A654EXW8_ARATH|nr:unnamed protein product [Arabidopsis thaliana]
MESTTFLKDAVSVKLHAKAKELFANGDHIKALEIIEDMICVNKEDKNIWFLYSEQGYMFTKLSEKAENLDVDFTFKLGAVGCSSEHEKLLSLCAHGFHTLAHHIGSVMYYKKCLKKAKQCLSVSNQSEDSDSSVAQMSLHKNKTNKDLETLIKNAETAIALSKIGKLKGLLEEDDEPEVLESKSSSEPVKNEIKGLRSFWLGLNVKVKRDFMKVSIAKLTSFVQRVYDRPRQNALEQILVSAREDRKWTFWMCQNCSEKFSSAEECKKHLEQEHAAGFKPSKEMDMKRIGKDWARKISVGGWEPVDTGAAVEMIKNRLADVKAFSYKNGWSKEWPLAADDERGKLLKEIKNLLVMFRDLKILPCSVRDCVMQYPLRYFGELEVSKQSLVDSHLVETPQSICFLDCHELNKILNFLKRIKSERDDGIDVVSRAVDSILSSTRVKEKVDFDPQFSLLLLDRRLLKSNNAPINDEGTINVFDPNVYPKAPAQGDDIISWLTDYNSVEKTFPIPIRVHNLDIWVAVLRAVQFTCRTLETKYAKKVQVFNYSVALTAVEDLCISEDERRRNLQEDQWNSYASLLSDRCEEGVLRNSLTTKLFVCAVRDVLEGASDLTFEFPDFEECMNLIRGRKSLSDDIVLKSIAFLKILAHTKVMLIDSKILLIDKSRISLLNDLTRLSVFDNRTYLLELLKNFLLNEIIIMASKAKLDAAAAAEADLLLEEEKKSQSKKRKNTSKKKTSTSISSPLSKTVEHKSSDILEPESTSPSLGKVEEDSMEPDATLSSERGRLEISPNTVNQEEVTQNIPVEDSQSEHLESALRDAATRYNSALDMTLKALLNIQILKEDLMQPFQDHPEEHVPPALRNFFTAIVSDGINVEGVYSCLLRDLLASLEEVISMSSDAAEVLVTILESWHCWKNAERESLVTRLFTLEENERMSCRKCRKKPNYPEQSSYGIVMAADSIRDLKCALGNIEFVDILKVIRMDYTMLCDVKTGGCGITNLVHHILSKCPPVFIIVLEWEKSETEKEISETTKALYWEIDISRMYEGLKPNTKYRLVSMVGCGVEEEEHICIAYENNRWFNLRHDALTREDVGNWKSVVGFCEERKVRPEILFYEATGSIDSLN